MQNSISARRISHKWLTVAVLFVMVALLIGFAAGIAIDKSSSAMVSPVIGQSGSTQQVAPYLDLTTNGNVCSPVYVDPSNSKPIAC